MNLTNKIRNNKEQWVQLLKYLIIGGSTALLELVLFTIFSFDINTSLSNILAVVISTVLNFFLNGKISFKQSDNILRSAILYTILFLINLAFSTVTINLLIHHFEIHRTIAKAMTMVCIVIWNFFLYRKVVFRKAVKSEAE